MERLQRGDLVRITGGNEKGKQGRVKRILVDSGKVIVEGVNLAAACLQGDADRSGDGQAHASSREGHGWQEGPHCQERRGDCRPALILSASLPIGFAEGVDGSSRSRDF